MLCLRRRKNERIVMDGGITVNVLEITRSTVLLGFDAPSNIGIMRQEVAEQPVTEGRRRQLEVERAATEGRLHRLEEALDALDNRDDDQIYAAVQSGELTLLQAVKMLAGDPHAADALLARRKRAWEKRR